MDGVEKSASFVDKPKKIEKRKAILSHWDYFAEKTKNLPPNTKIASILPGLRRKGLKPKERGRS